MYQKEQIGRITIKQVVRFLCCCIIAALLFPGIAFASETSNYYDYVLENNQKMRQEYANPNDYLKMEQSDFKELSNKIVSGICGDYQKVQVIHNWVCENIYYDYYTYETGDHKTNAPEYTVDWLLKHKKGVCSYYAAIFERLVRAQGIPCRTVSGYAVNSQSSNATYNIDYSSRKKYLIQDRWTEANYQSGINHAWNEAYVNGKWINIDTTWDSTNQYTVGGNYVKGTIWQSYFDVSDDQFAKDHKIVKYGNHEEIAEREYRAFLESLQKKSPTQVEDKLKTDTIWDMFLENEYRSEANYYKKSTYSSTTITTTTTTSNSSATTETKHESTVESWESSDFDETGELEAWMDEIMAFMGPILGDWGLLR